MAILDLYTAFFHLITRNYNVGFNVIGFDKMAFFWKTLILLRNTTYQVNFASPLFQFSMHDSAVPLSRLSLC